MDFEVDLYELIYQSSKLFSIPIPKEIKLEVNKDDNIEFDYKEENNKAYGDIFNEIAGAINDEGFFKSQMTKEEMEEKISNPLSGINMESLIKTSAENAIGQLAQREIISRA